MTCRGCGGVFPLEQMARHGGRKADGSPKYSYCHVLKTLHDPSVGRGKRVPVTL